MSYRALLPVHDDLVDADETNLVDAGDVLRDHERICSFRCSIMAATTPPPSIVRMPISSPRSWLEAEPVSSACSVSPAMAASQAGQDELCPPRRPGWAAVEDIEGASTSRLATDTRRCVTWKPEREAAAMAPAAAVPSSHSGLDIGHKYATMGGVPARQGRTIALAYDNRALLPFRGGRRLLGSQRLPCGLPPRTCASTSGAVKSDQRWGSAMARVGGWRAARAIWCALVLVILFSFVSIPLPVRGIEESANIPVPGPCLPQRRLLRK